jgi:hypothetical protein
MGGPLTRGGHEHCYIAKRPGTRVSILNRKEVAMISERLAETVAMMAIGDGALCAVRPERHTKLWLGGPAWWGRMWRPVVDHPNFTRVLGLAGIGFGYWLASREWSRAEQERGTTSARRVAGKAIPAFASAGGCGCGCG